MTVTTHRTMHGRLKEGLLALSISMLVACGQAHHTPNATFADLVFINGEVVTLDDKNTQVEGVAVKDGKILVTGSTSEIKKFVDSQTKTVDLHGKTLVPGFIDGHSHFSHAVHMATWANVSPPPVGPAKDLQGIINALNENKNRHPLKEGQWLVGFGYDETALDSSINRYDLDKHFPDTPVLLMHISAHGAMLNSKALALSGITADTVTPEGGIIARIRDSQEPSGFVMETPWFPIAFKLMDESRKNLGKNFELALAQYAKHGYTTIQDGAAAYDDLKLYQQQAKAGHLYLDLVALPIFMDMEKVFVDTSMKPGDYQDRIKYPAIKVVLDGSPQGRTAYFTDSYLVEGPDGQQHWRGEPTMPYEEFEQIFLAIQKKGYGVYTHANGDATVDMVIKAHQKAGIHAADNQRNVVIHSQFMRPDQLDSYVEHGIVPSFFSSHTFYWGDAHIKNLGEKRAFFLSPMKSASQKGIRYSNHSDYIVTPLDTTMPLWTAVTRKSRSGKIIGPEERISVLQALKAMTIDAAYQYFEEDRKGSIEVGKLADVVVLDKNPLKVKVDEIRDVNVFATYKEGQAVYQSP